MYKCTRCKRDTWDTDSQGLCRECLGGIETIYSKDAIARLTTVPAHCFAIVQDVGYVWTGGRLLSGDLFITTGGIVYIAYWTTMLSQGSRAVTGALIGGLVGGLIGAVSDAASDSDRRQSLEDLAQRTRDEDYCMSIEDRIRKHGALVIPTQAIQSLESDRKKKIICILHDGGRLALSTTRPQTCKRLIKQLANGTIQDEPDWWGVNVGGVSVSALLDALEADNSLAGLDDQALAQVASNKKFMDKLYSMFQRLKRHRQKKITKGMARFPGSFRDVFRGYISKERQKTKRSLVALVGVAFIIITVVMLVAVYAFKVDWMLIVILTISVEAPIIFLLIRTILQFRHVNGMTEHLGAGKAFSGGEGDT